MNSFSAKILAETNYSKAAQRMFAEDRPTGMELEPLVALREISPGDRVTSQIQGTEDLAKADVFGNVGNICKGNR